MLSGGAKQGIFPVIENSRENSDAAYIRTARPTEARSRQTQGQRRQGPEKTGETGIAAKAGAVARRTGSASCIGKIGR
jgi:hypothetical protein